MAKAKTNKAAEARRDLHQEVTDKIIAMLEKGTRPWVRSWGGPGEHVPLLVRPRNADGKPYSGINVLVLWSAMEAKGFESPFWLTYERAASEGGQVRRGESHTPIVFAGSRTVQDTETGEDKTIPTLKHFRVFNADQIDGLPEKYRPQPVTPVVVHEGEKPVRIKEADDFFDALGFRVIHRGLEAKYSPHLDRIYLPGFETFHSAAGYYSTRFHESVHMTGHSSRLERDLTKTRFGDEGYAMEELVAEIGAAFGCSDLGIVSEVREDHASYVASWLKVLKNDKRAIFTAASAAEKAVQFIHKIVNPTPAEEDDSHQMAA